MSEIEAKKSLGQNFLTDQNIIRKIIQAINPQVGETIIEVGPGQGALTEHLLAAGAHVIALEMDERMLVPLDALNEKYDGRLTVIIGDALKQNLTTLTQGKYKLVGNLPYNVGTQIVFNAIKMGAHISAMTFMLQKEVIQRITANVNDNHWGRLAVWCDLYCSRKRLFDVPPTAFFPQPKVTSSIVSLIPLDEKRFNADDKKLSYILQSTFTKRRKMLRASLKSILDVEQIESIGVKATQRPETLTTEQFCLLSDKL
ncbi:MAG: 16S rRNA (adenine1518-N6/adenine1519-N6)-dimethyltransferase [Alphaproteobacteria bacterium]|jgi:16S rRNA (adenine1518-N6/adenine1519-N6)-dimethyltransferase